MSSGAAGRPHTMLIVAGHLTLDPADRDAMVADGAAVLAAARNAPGCLDFALSADPLDATRVNVFERWESEAALLAFRGTGPDADTAARIRGGDVRRYTVSDVGPA